MEQFLSYLEQQIGNIFSRIPPEMRQSIGQMIYSWFKSKATGELPAVEAIVVDDLKNNNWQTTGRPSDGKDQAGAIEAALYYLFARVEDKILGASGESRVPGDNAFAGIMQATYQAAVVASVQPHLSNVAPDDLSTLVALTGVAALAAMGIS